MPETASKPYYQRISYRLLKSLFRSISINVGQHSIRVPLIDEAGLYLLHWKNSWKTSLIVKRLNSRPGVLLDVGANVGQTMLDFLCARTGSVYFGFEPNITAAAYMARVIQINKIENAHLVPVALSNSASLASISIQQGNSRYSSDAIVTEQFRPSHTFDKSFIACFPLDSILPSLQAPDISMIKIDAEHSELLVLQGMQETLRHHRPPVCCEVLHHDSIFPAEQYHQHLLKLETILLTLDYTIYHVIYQGDEVHYRLVPVASFPRSIFTEQSYHECDYLFLPKEMEASLFQDAAKT